MNKGFIGNCYTVLEGDLVLCFTGRLKCFAKTILQVLSGFSTFETNTKEKKQQQNCSVSTEFLCLYKVLPSN